ncbi:hypothetical protein [uncultured Dechloromonas sp.]|uniref:hypothetical protein n=1 Tax=uncultured Dechloromonas sp. TaxID=171719 RepID=UPI0025E36F5A|nr:hypothetical protein [uncultured Dechloromonas sp.]
MEHRLKRALTTPFILLAAFVLWFWEWLWEPLQGAMAWLARWPLLRQVDAWVAGAPRYVALALFLLPGAALLPFKLAGLYFLAHGAPLLGVLTFMAAKIVGTALLARIFTLTKTQLLTIAWFARAYAAVTRFKSAVFARLHAHPAYRRLHAALSALRRRSRQVRRGLAYHLRSRWRAVMRRAQRRGRMPGL